MKVSFVLAFLALATVMVYGQERSNMMLDQLTSYGTGVVLVPIDRAALTVTATGMSDTAAQAVADSNNLQSRINDTLRNFTIIDIRNGGLYLEPLYTGSSLTFAAHTSLSVVINAVDTPALIDSMVALGASNISFIFTPDFFAVARAQRQSLQLAVADALYRAQAVLDTIGHCAFNISYVAIRNPALELPSLTFNLYANMGNMNNLGNMGRDLNINRGSEMLNNNMNNNNQGNSNNNFMSSRPMMLGAAAPYLEGDREEVVSYVEIWISHAACSAGGSGMMTDITSSLDLSNIVGIAGGILGSPVASASASEMSGSEVASPSGSELGSATLGVRSTMW